MAQNYQGLKFWAKSAQRKAFSALFVYKLHRKEKRALYARAQDDRDKYIKQHSLFKVLKVGEYWYGKSQTKGVSRLPCSSWQSRFDHIDMKKAFLRWFAFAKSKATAAAAAARGCHGF